MKRRKMAVVGLALVLVAAACGRDDAPDTSSASTEAVSAATTAPATTAASAASSTAAGADAPATTEAAAEPADPCAGVTLEATEIGVSADTITVLVMADVGSELAPGLFQGSIDGTKAWAKAVNESGGLACRQVEVLEWDSKITPAESTNGMLQACEKAVAMVGSTALLVSDITPIESCPDLNGDPTGIADIPERANDTQHQCSDHVFTVGGRAGSCPYSGEGERTYAIQKGAYTQYREILGEDLHGVYVFASDLPTTLAQAMATVRVLNDSGFVSDGVFGASGRSEQAAFAEFVAAMKSNDSNIAIGGSNDQSMIKFRSEAAAQGLDDSGVLWTCGLACYTDAFRSDPNTDGTYVSIGFLPFEERDSNAELDTFLTEIGTPFPQSWAVGAWNSGRAFEHAINDIVAADGPNGITRAKILATMPTITDFDANGWIGSVDFSNNQVSPCFVLLQLQGGEFVRVFPAEKATLDCSPDNVGTWTGDGAAEFQG